MRGSAIHPSLVARSTGSFVNGPSVLRGNIRNRPKQERGADRCTAEGAGQGAIERKFHIGKDFIMLTVRKRRCPIVTLACTRQHLSGIFQKTLSALAAGPKSRLKNSPSGADALVRGRRPRRPPF